jgi:hypothetical protein
MFLKNQHKYTCTFFVSCESWQDNNLTLTVHIYCCKPSPISFTNLLPQHANLAIYIT